MPRAVAQVTSRDISSPFSALSDRMNSRWIPTPRANIAGAISRTDSNGSMPAEVNRE